jgi:hypothetical protein
MFGWKGDLNEAQMAEITTGKRVIFDGFNAAVAGCSQKPRPGFRWMSSLARPFSATRRPRASPLPVWRKGAGRRNSISSMARLSPAMSRLSPQPSARCWCATIRRATGPLIAAGVPGFIGFAVGRTDFREPLVAWRAKKMMREEAVAEIARHYGEFVDIFEKAFREGRAFDRHPARRMMEFDRDIALQERIGTCKLE